MKRSVALTLGFVVLGAIAGLLIFQQIDRHRAPAIVIEDPRSSAEIVVAVEGAVAAPGTYTLSANARVQHALDAAGGPTDDADLTGLNLAARLRDEERLVIPSLSAVGVASVVQGSTAVSTPPSSAPASTKININSADAATLDTLPGIGPTLAARIIDYREANGPFSTIDELAVVSGISLAMVDEMRDLITV